MADETKSFSDLLSEAPLASAENTVSLVGALARSSESGKFVLTTGPGSSVTLDVDAVKSYQVISGGVGQLIVQVDVDRASVPESATEASKAAPAYLKGIHDVKRPTLDKYPWEEPVKTSPEYDLGYAAKEASGGAEIRTGIYDLKHPYSDIKHPILDKYPWEEVVKTNPETDLSYSSAAAAPARDYFTGVWDIKHPILDKHPWEEPVRTNPELDLPPFALATPQQAPASALSAMQGAASTQLRTVLTYDITTGYRDHYKNPILDATGRPPYLD